MEQGFDVGQDTSQSLIDHLDGEKALALLGSVPEKYRDAIYLQYVEVFRSKKLLKLRPRPRIIFLYEFIVVCKS